ncbi:hypothetical protein AYK20_00825 [Thermoplasmatales archaeon SG8-52-1]|nr:MAG: hypothetical protein AYK20_00825 [Thermoplasmatales archaeon SG8-52-1]
MKNNAIRHNLKLPLINNEISLGAFIAFLIGALFYLLSLVEVIKNYDTTFKNFLKGSGIILIITGILVIILTFIYRKIIGQFNVGNNDKIDSNIIIAVCPKCKNKFNAVPKKIDDFIVIQCNHCGLKLKKR